MRTEIVNVTVSPASSKVEFVFVSEMLSVAADTIVLPPEAGAVEDRESRIKPTPLAAIPVVPETTESIPLESVPIVTTRIELELVQAAEGPVPRLPEESVRRLLISAAVTAFKLVTAPPSVG